MIFKRAAQRYGRTPEPETPYQRAGQLWDERIGSARVQARNWRLMALGCLALTALSSGGLLWQSTRSRVTPYVVEVDRLGEARAVSEADAAYHPTDPQIAWHLSRFIAAVRGRSLDPLIVRQDWLDAYAFATRRGGQFLGAYARSADPFADIGERTVTVQVTSVVRASDRSFQLKWTETAYEHGASAGLSHWTAILTVATIPPKTTEILRRNPLGIYVDAIDWSEEQEPPPPALPTTAPTAPVRSPGDRTQPILSEPTPSSTSNPETRA